MYYPAVCFDIAHEALMTTLHFSRFEEGLRSEFDISAIEKIAQGFERLSQGNLEGVGKERKDENPIFGTIEGIYTLIRYIQDENKDANLRQYFGDSAKQLREMLAGSPEKVQTAKRFEKFFDELHKVGNEIGLGMHSYENPVIFVYCKLFPDAKEFAVR